MQLNGVKSVDWEYISCVITDIIKNLSDYCHTPIKPEMEGSHVKYVVEMSNFKINMKGDG
jgi:hypothetical protein